MGLAQSRWGRNRDMVRFARRTLELNSGGLLVCVRQHSLPAVHPSALVREALHLVSVPLARLKTGLAPCTNASGPLCRPRISGKKCLRLRSHPFCSGVHARRRGCQPNPVPGRKLAVLQAADRRLCWLFCSCHPCSASDVHAEDGQRKKEGAGRLRSAGSALRGRLRTTLGDRRAVPFGLEDISRLAAATAAPLLPLLLTIFSPEELFMRVVKIVF